MRIARDTQIVYLAMAGCVVLALAMDVLAHIPAYDWLNGISTLNAILWSCFVMLWLRLSQRRFVDRGVRRCVAAAVLLLLALQLMRTLRYAYVDDERARRYLWYGYYVSFTFAPTVLLLAVLHAGVRVNEGIRRTWWLLLAVPALLSLLVLTNDLHMWAFRFAGGVGSDPAGWDDNHVVRGPVFVACWGWLALAATMSIVIPLKRYAQRTQAHAWWRLLLPLAAAVLYLVASVRWSGARLFSVLKPPDVMVLLVVVYVECLVGAGLFPSNEGYAELWRASTLRGGFVDANGVTHLSSAGTPQLTPQQVWAAREKPVELGGGDMMLVARDVRGGTAYWVRDLGPMHRLQARLADTSDDFAEEQAMLRAEMELARQREATIQRELLYRQIEERMAPQLALLEARLGRLPVDEDAFVLVMQWAAMEAVYLKRCANLTLLGEYGAIELRELELALGESMARLQALGVATRGAWEPQGGPRARPAMTSSLAAPSQEVPADVRLGVQETLLIYEAYQTVLEASLPLLRRLSVMARVDEGRLTLRFAFEGPDELLPCHALALKASELGGSLHEGSCERQMGEGETAAQGSPDQTLYLEISMPLASEEVRGA